MSGGLFCGPLRSNQDRREAFPRARPCDRQSQVTHWGDRYGQRASGGAPSPNGFCGDDAGGWPRRRRHQTGFSERSRQIGRVLHRHQTVFLAFLVLGLALSRHFGLGGLPLKGQRGEVADFLVGFALVRAGFLLEIAGVDHVPAGLWRCPGEAARGVAF